MQGAGSVRGKTVEVHNQGGFAVVSVSALDDLPLATSRRLLVIHLTDVQNTAARFRDATWTTLTDWGKLPHLVRRGSADIRIHSADKMIVRALQLDGKPAHEMECRHDSDAWAFRAATVQPQGTFLVYEVERK